ncbi:hypothetical protein AVEN_194211-1 [Araneus ventricosus]|uniref:Uncharacterized protein n=1 Tax=Araneus ventricosus TaxID=182803 RepID=A0A4Y2T5B6_ARAVE|nr:hypothetical protein AVEN_194211-1 [Araneus ventricosus]
MNKGTKHRMITSNPSGAIPHKTLLEQEAALEQYLTKHFLSRKSPGAIPHKTLLELEIALEQYLPKHFLSRKSSWSKNCWTVLSCPCPIAVGVF